MKLSTKILSKALREVSRLDYPKATMLLALYLVCKKADPKHLSDISQSVGLDD